MNDLLVLKVIREEKDGFYCYSHDGKKKLGGPYPTKVQAQRRLRQVEHFKDEAKDEVAKRLEELRKRGAGRKRGGGGEPQAYDSRGRYTSGGGSGTTYADRDGNEVSAEQYWGSSTRKPKAPKAPKAPSKIKPVLRVLGKAAIGAGIVGIYAYSMSTGMSTTKMASTLDADLDKIIKGMDLPPRRPPSGGGRSRDTGPSFIASQVAGNTVRTGPAAPKRTNEAKVDWSNIHRGNLDQAFPAWQVDSSGNVRMAKADDGVMVVMSLEDFDKDKYIAAVMAAVAEQKAKSQVAKRLEELRKAAGRKRGGGGAPQAYDARGRYTSGGAGAAIGAAGRAAGRAVRSTVNTANAKKVARTSMAIAKPIIVTVGKAAFAGAMAGLVLGVEHTFSSAGTDVGKAAGAAATAAAQAVKTKAEAKADVYITAKVGRNGVRVQPAQRVDPQASSFDLSRVDVSTPAGVSSPFGRPINTPGASRPTSAVTRSPFMVHNTNMLKDIAKAEAELSDEDTWVVVPVDDYDERKFVQAIDDAVAVRKQYQQLELRKRLMVN